MNQTISLHEHWSVSRKISFRFISIFFLLYMLPFPIDQIPRLGDYVSGWYYDFWSFLNE
ncbi:MAG: hypothetical protein HEP71_17515 [Roseivirga sp.]|nr:hypothetical protein [Roseivirga sp.]